MAAWLIRGASARVRCSGERAHFDELGAGAQEGARVVDVFEYLH